MLRGLRNMAKIAPAKILSQHSHAVHGKLKITEYFFEVPKDYSKPNAGTIKLFARAARKRDTAAVPDTGKDKDQLPYVCYLEGGPGCGCLFPDAYGWVPMMLERGYQAIFIDQRGTGLSTPITSSTLQMRGSVEVQAKYVKLYRADNIVRDCEAVRLALTADYPEEKKKWTTVGQSYGGFCTTTYLSFHPEGLRECFVLGGLPALDDNPDEVYRATCRTLIERNHEYYAKYPEDVDRVRSIMNYLQRFGDGKIKLPSEGSLTRRRFRHLGIFLGFHSGMTTIHNIVTRASYEIEAFGHMTRKSLAAVEAAENYDDNLVYSLLHEPLYCQGKAPNWSAERMLAEHPEFALDNNNKGPIFFTGEMIFPWMFEDYSELRKVQDVAMMVAEDSDWPALYDQAQLAKNEVPVYAASYVRDMYVPFAAAEQTARKIRNCKVFTTNVMFHNAMRSRTEEVFKQLFDLRDDVID